MFFAIWLFALKIPKSGQDASQNGLKLVILGSKMTILGPSWLQLSAIFAPTWLILVPRWAPRGTFLYLFRRFLEVSRQTPKKRPKLSEDVPKIVPKMLRTWCQNA